MKLAMPENIIETCLPVVIGNEQCFYKFLIHENTVGPYCCGL